MFGSAFIASKLLKLDINKTQDLIGAGFGSVASMIDERKFTPEEKSKADAKLIDNALEFQKSNLEQSSERSKARREVAINWIIFYLGRIIPLYLLSVLISVYRPELKPLVEAFKEVMILMGTGTLMVLGFFFGTHLFRQGKGMFKK